MKTKTLRVFYAPHLTNQRLVKKLSGDIRLRRCEFISLRSDSFNRRLQLEGIEGRAVFIWGNIKNRMDLMGLLRMLEYEKKQI